MCLAAMQSGFYDFSLLEVQTKITDYFELIDQIEFLASSNPQFNNILQEACKIQQQRLSNHNLVTQRGFLSFA